MQLKRRYDLIPNLVETAKAYMAHERETLEAVIAARNQAMAGLAAAANSGDGAAMKELAGAEGILSNAMGRLNVVMEAYPDLKANTNMMQLTEEPNIPKTKWHSPAKPLTIRSPSTTPIALHFRQYYSPACSVIRPMQNCWNLRTRQKFKLHRRCLFNNA